MKPLIERLKDRCVVDGDCWLWNQATNGEGHPLMGLTELKGKAPVNVRRLMFLVACGHLTPKQVVTAECENRLCIAPAHLRAMGVKQFQRTGYFKRTRSSGKAHGAAVSASIPTKLGDKAEEILRRLREGELQKDLAKEYGVHDSTISSLWRGRTFGHLSPFAGLRKSSVSTHSQGETTNAPSPLLPAGRKVRADDTE